MSTALRGAGWNTARLEATAPTREQRAKTAAPRGRVVLPAQAPSHARALLYALAFAALASLATLGLAALSAQEPAQAALGAGIALFAALAGAEIGRRQDALAVLAAIDPLTGLWNRRTLDARLRREAARSSRQALPLAMLVVDIDNLKQINDRRGHQAGDEALALVASVLSSVCRSSDVAARYGGDEFVLLAPDTRASDALNLGERIRARLGQITSEWAASVGPLTVSIGIVDVDALNGMEPRSLFAVADRALYMAKACGRNCVFLATRTGGVT